MSKKKPPETDSTEHLIPIAAAEWLTVFKKHFSLAFKDELASQSTTTLQDSDLQQAAIGAMISTLRDSGLSEDQMLGMLEVVFDDVQTEPIEWKSEMAQRRVDLIDRKIAGSISFDEKIELAGLTNSLRISVDNEERFPMEGARALHAKLKAMDAKEDQR